MKALAVGLGFYAVVFGTIALLGLVGWFIGGGLGMFLAIVLPVLLVCSYIVGSAVLSR